MSQLGSIDNKKVAYQIAKYLKSMKDSSPSHATREELDGIINQLCGLFEIDLTSIEDFKAYNYYQYSFPELFSAGKNFEHQMQKFSHIIINSAYRCQNSVDFFFVSILIPCISFSCLIFCIINERNHCIERKALQRGPR
jgi:hypothetical protein